LALATASHFGEPRHVAVVIRLLERIGCTDADLTCPPAMPLDERSRALLLAAEEPPRRIYMNCSGKHAAMLATCVHNGWPLADYYEHAHPLQQAVTATVVEVTGEPETELGIDGCGLPVVPVSLINLARAFATLATAPAGTPERRLVDAALADPYLIAGTGGEDPTLMAAVPGLFTKVGAEGVHAGAMPDGTAFALKIDDGSQRARVPLVAAILSWVGVTASDALLDLAAAPVLGGGARVGTVRALPGLFAQR
jgi:L-asparaginase II